MGQTLFEEKPCRLLAHQPRQPPGAAGQARRTGPWKRRGLAAWNRAAGDQRRNSPDLHRLEPAGLLLPALAQFMPDYPALALELSTSNDFANLNRRDADIALRLTKTSEHLVGRCLEQRDALSGVFSAPILHDDMQDVTWPTWPGSHRMTLPDHPTVAWRRAHLPGVPQLSL